MWANPDLLFNEPFPWENLLEITDDLPLEFEAPVVDVSRTVSYATTVMDKTYSEIDELDQRIKALFEKSAISVAPDTQEIPKQKAASKARIVLKRKKHEKTSGTQSKRIGEKATPAVGKHVSQTSKQPMGDDQDVYVDIISTHDDEASNSNMLPIAAPIREPLPQQQVSQFKIKMITEEWTADLKLNRTEEIAATAELIMKLTQDYSLPDLLMDALNMEINDAIVKIRLINPPPNDLTIRIEQPNSGEYLLKTHSFINLDHFFDSPVKALYQINRINKASCIQLDLKLCN